MSIETEIAALTAASNALVASVNTSRAELDQTIVDAATSADAATLAASNAATEAVLAEASAGVAAASAAAAQAGVDRYFATIAEGVAGTAIGSFFASAESGSSRVYQRTGSSPFYVDQGDGSAIASRALLASSNGSGLVGWAAGGVGSVVRTVLSKLREVAAPEDYGCVGDYYLPNGTVNPTPTNDAVNFQKALDDLKPGQKLRLNNVYNLAGNSVTLQTRLVTLEGPGGIANGTLNIGNTTTRTDYFVNVTGVIFDGGSGIAAGAGTREGVSLRLARWVTFQGCRFLNLDKGVSVPIFTNQQFHGTGIIRVKGCHFNNVNYAWYSTHDDVTDAWMFTNDCAFSDNVVNISYLTAVYAKGIDGMHVSNNVFFNYSYNGGDAALKAKKEYNVWIGQSDWVHVTGNNCFESGLEAIVLSNPKHHNISGNHIAWCGQKAPASGILITGSNASMNGTIENNTIARFTKHGIDIQTNLDSATYSTITVVGNNLEYLSSTAMYYGAVSLGSIPHYGVYQPTNCPTTVQTSNNSLAGVTNLLQNSPSQGVTLGVRTRVEGYRAQVSVTAANAPVAILANLAPSETTSYSGLLVVIASSNASQSGNCASYVLHVTKAQGSTSAISQISAQGLITGGSANWPSFTWTFDSTTNQLRATPIGSTSGSFYFDIASFGAIRVFLPA